MELRMAGKRSQKGPDFTYVSPDEVRFDESNPRFGGEAKRLSQPEIQKLLEDFPHHALELVDSLVQNGYIAYEPIVVRKDGDKYVVIEGNRRLAAVKHITANPDKFPKRSVSSLNVIPVLIFKEKADASRLEEVRTYLGVRHLLGYREWPPESKAIFLDQHIKSADDLKRVTKELGIAKNTIARHLIPYRVKEAASDILERADNIKDVKFWTLGEALTRSDIKEYIKLDVDPDSLRVRSFDKSKFRYLLEFLYGAAEEGRKGGYRAVGSARITETRQLSRLARVLSAKRAAEKLEKGSTLEDAELYVETREETVEALIDELRILLQRIIQLQPSAPEVRKIGDHLQSFQRAVQSFTKHAEPV
jgi:hypothetical protein